MSIYHLFRFILCNKAYNMSTLSAIIGTWRPNVIGTMADFPIYLAYLSSVMVVVIQLLTDAKQEHS